MYVLLTIDICIYRPNKLYMSEYMLRSHSLDMYHDLFRSKCTSCRVFPGPQFGRPTVCFWLDSFATCLCNSFGVLRQQYPQCVAVTAAMADGF